MNIDYVSHEEIARYYKNPDLLTARAKKIRLKLIIGLIVGFTVRLTSIFKYLFIKDFSALKNKERYKKFKISAS